MKAIVKVRPEPGGTDILDVEMPVCGPNDALVKMDVVSICGTDVHIYNWDKWARNAIKPPLIYGHEFSGTVVEVGKNIDYLNEGDSVSGECHIYCGHCQQCKLGNAHICENLTAFGVSTPGVFCEYQALPAQNLWVNDPKIPKEYLSLQDPLGNAVHTVFSTDVTGRNVAILGCGPIGLMAIAVAKAAGAAQVVAVGHKNEYRMDLAKKVGADHVLRAGDDFEKISKELTGGVGMDAVFEITGNPSAVLTGMRMARKGGTLALLGIFNEPVTIELNDNVIFKCLDIKGIYGRRIWDTWILTTGLLKSGKLNLDPIITHRFKFDDFLKGMETMVGGNSGKIIIDI
ncbi:MAG: L-threonine 3-dehydrogenase [Candidatus Methanofastidiosa archaeon]|nr:L-threonine 3-dehydrogenase [Candidatus Methanofastidiosa archaeon]